MTNAEPEPAIRRAQVDDSEQLAEVFWRVRHENSSTIPALVHPLDDVRRWAREQVFAEHDVWVAEAGGELVGFMALKRPDWIGHLYVDRGASGQGLGSQFIALAKRELAGSIQLWTFQSNLGAQRFYERHGFVPVQWTEGDNEEGAPDVRFVFDRA